MDNTPRGKLPVNYHPAFTSYAFSNAAARPVASNNLYPPKDPKNHRGSAGWTDVPPLHKAPK
jgi:hypothetical protein